MKLPGEGFIKYNSRYMDCAFYSSGVLWVARTAGLYKIILNRKTEMLNSVKNVSSNGFSVFARTVRGLKTFEMRSIAINVATFNPKLLYLVRERHLFLSCNQIHCIRGK